MQKMWDFFDQKPENLQEENLCWIVGLLGMLFISGSGSGSLSWITSGGLAAGGGAYAIAGIAALIWVVNLRAWWGFIDAWLTKDSWTTFYAWRWSLIDVLLNGVNVAMWAVLAILWGWTGTALYSAMSGFVTLAIAYYAITYIKMLWYHYDGNGSEADNAFDWYALTEPSGDSLSDAVDTAVDNSSSDW
jgi:hypothetical protein